MRILIIVFVSFIVASQSQAGWKDWIPWGKKKIEQPAVEKPPAEDTPEETPKPTKKKKSSFKNNKSDKPLPDVEPANYRDQIVCYFGLLNHAKGDNRSINNGMILVAGDKDGKEGFYLYSPKISYFCKLPSNPVESNKQYNLYYFQLEIPQKETMYMTYGTAIGNQPHPMVNGSLAPSEEHKDKYVPAECVGDTGQSALSNFNKELIQRVTTVHEQFQKHADYMLKAYKKEVPSDKPKAALRACFKASKAVKASAIKELEKFKK